MDAEAILPAEGRYIEMVAEEAFGAFFRAEHQPMMQLAVALVDFPDRAEEIVQDAFERTLLAWPRRHH